MRSAVYQVRTRTSPRTKRRKTCAIRLFPDEPVPGSSGLSAKVSERSAAAAPHRDVGYGPAKRDALQTSATQLGSRGHCAQWLGGSRAVGGGSSSMGGSAPAPVAQTRRGAQLVAAAAAAASQPARGNKGPGTKASQPAAAYAGAKRPRAADAPVRVAA